MDHHGSITTTYILHASFSNAILLLAMPTTEFVLYAAVSSEFLPGGRVVDGFTISSEDGNFPGLVIVFY